MAVMDRLGHKWKSLKRKYHVTMQSAADVRSLETIWRKDLEATAEARKNPPQLDQRSQEALDHLREFGWVNLGQLGINLKPTAEKCRQIFDDLEKKHPDCGRFFLSHPFFLSVAVCDVLKHDVVNNIVRTYLGAQVIYDYMQLFTLREKWDVNAVSGLWHHDRVGRRLKMFVLLTDLAEDGRPTLYAQGSHARTYYSNSMAASRFPTDFVEKNFNVVKLTGKLGDGVLVDTNGLHRASWEGGKTERVVMVYEYSDYSKSEPLYADQLPIGVRREVFPKDFDTAGSLMKPELMVEHATHKQYAEHPNILPTPYGDTWNYPDICDIKPPA